MSVPMGRRRQSNHDLPPHMHRKVRGGVPRFYYGRQAIALGADFPAALRKYAELHTGFAAPGTFADAVARYKCEELPKKEAATRAGYEPQLVTLAQVFGDMPLNAIRPKDVGDFMDERAKRTVDEKGRVHGGPIVATREKALLSAVITFARRKGLMDGPNPCAGMKGTKSKRDRMVTHAELADACARAKPMLAAYLELCYLTGQRPADVLRMRRQDVQDGTLVVKQGKTGAKVRIELVGPLAALVARLCDVNPAPAPLQRDAKVASLYLIRDDRGQRMTVAAMRKRFELLECDWQVRDLRAKAASDSATSRAAQTLLGHAAATTTDGYIRQRAGERATPIMRRITDKPS